MKREGFFSTKPLEEAIHTRLKDTSGELVNWLRICWMRFTKSEPYKMFYKESMEVDTEFKILDLLPCRGRPKNFDKIKLTPLYKSVRPISTSKYKDMMELLRADPSTSMQPGMPQFQVEHTKLPKAYFYQDFFTKQISA
uniref:Uncharacterized protein n=1 Tax=Glossina pallidipes TaxID=7398 RepID=A0A1A9ZAL8_GLOPL